MGAHFRMRLAVRDRAGPRSCGQGTELPGGLRQRGGGRPLPEVRFPTRLLLAVGNERHGVSDSLPFVRPRSCHSSARRGAESLNAAIAGSIMMYAFSQQFARPDLQP